MKIFDVQDPETTLLILKGAKAKIEQGWTKGTQAMDRRGHCVSPHSPEAVQWCLIGAINAQAEDFDQSDLVKARLFLNDVLGFNGMGSAMYFNDHYAHSPQQVTEVIDMVMEEIRKGN